MNIFKNYDVRGVYGREVTPETALRIGQAFGTFLGKNKRVLIGRDLRTSSVVLQDCFSSGLMSTGCKVIDMQTNKERIIHLGLFFKQ